MTDSSADGRIPARPLAPGAGSGRVLVLDAPLSFWGGCDERGVIVDRHHPQAGESLAGRVLVMPSGRGSSSSSSVLAELIRSGHAPAAILLTEADTIVVLGALTAAELYDLRVPVVAIADPADAATIRAGSVVAVTAGAERAVVQVLSPRRSLG